MHPSFLPKFNKTPMKVFRFIDLNGYLCFVNYPGKESLLRYERQFELELPCALFLIPKERQPMLRYYTTATAISHQVV